MVTVKQCKQIVKQFLQASGRGGFLTGQVTAITPLSILADNRLPLTAADLYVTDSCVGLSINLKHKHSSSEDALMDQVILRRPLQVGDGVLLLSRPDGRDGSRYILLDRIQPYAAIREVSTNAP